MPRGARLALRRPGPHMPASCPRTFQSEARSVAMKLLLVLAIAYLAILAFLYFAQTWLVFPGWALPSRPIEGPLPHERIDLATPDGERLQGLLFRAEQPGADLLIGFGGNAQDAEFLAHDLADDFRNMNVAVFHYRGYGPSTGRPSERA